MPIKRHNFFVLLFLSVLVLLPFNDSIYFRDILREMASELSIYPLLVFIAFFTFINYKILFFESVKLVRDPLFYMIVLLFASILLGALANFDTITTNLSHGRTGIAKFVGQFLIMALWFYSSWLTCILIQNIRLKYIVYAIITSSIIIIVFFALEVLYKLDVGIANDITEWLNENYFYVTYPKDFPRYKSISSEPGWLARIISYYAAILGSTIFFLWKSKKNCAVSVLFVLAMLLIVLYFTYSRSIVFLVFFIPGYALIYFFMRKKIKKGLLKGIVYFILSIIIYFSTQQITHERLKKSNLETQEAGVENSRSSRIYGIYAGLSMAGDHPILGVGLGQNGFHFKRYMEKLKEEVGSLPIDIERNLIDDKDNHFYGLSTIYTRLLAETGAVGLFLFLGIHFYLVYKLFMLGYRSPHDLTKILSATVIMLIFFNLTNYTATESSRYIQYWIVIGVAWGMIGNRSFFTLKQT